MPEHKYQGTGEVIMHFLMVEIDFMMHLARQFHHCARSAEDTCYGIALHYLAYMV